MTDKWEGVVGSKEEFYPPKRIRKALGLRPRMTVRSSVEWHRLVVEPMPTVEDLLGMGTKVSVTLDELRDDRRQLSKRLEEGRGKGR